MTKLFGTALLTALIACSGYSAYAGLPAELGKCSAVLDATKRVACYDVLATKYAGPEVSEAERRKAAWRIATTVSPITDKKDVFLRRRSEQSIKTSILGQAHPVLLIQCINGKTSVAVNWDLIVDGGKLPVTYRIDSEEPKTVEITVSNDFRSIVSLSSKRSIGFLKSLFGKKRLAVQLTSLTYGQIAAVFDVAGFDGIISPLRKSCGW